MKFKLGVFFLLINTMSCMAMRLETKLYREISSSLDLKVPFLPKPFQFHNNTYMVYEIAITNSNSLPVQLHNLAIYDAASSQLIRRYDETTLDFVYLDNENAPIESKALQPTATALIYIWLEFSSNTVLPQKLSHTIEGLIGEKKFIASSENIEVSTKAPISIGSPFKQQGTWYVANGPSANSPHRKAVLPVPGPLYLPQRFAIDWVLIGKDNRAFKNEGDHILDWYGFGQEVVAVADGVITGIRNDIRENQIKSRAVPITLDTALGNFVSLAIDEKHVAVYAHLMINSVRVKVGERVKKGQVLGRIGNTGNSDAPHLHLHISQGPHPLLSQGQSYTFDTLSLRGMNSSCEALLSGGNAFSPFIFEPNSCVLHNQLPTDNSLLKL